MRLRTTAVLLGALACVLALSCSDDPTSKRTTRKVADDEDRSERKWFEDDVDLPHDPPISLDDEAKKLVYLVSRADELYSFDPRIPGKSAYRLVGKLECTRRGTPQSMAVDRKGWAWVFFDSGELFKVSVRDASCSPPLPYRHPSYNRQLGMGFTAMAPGSADEQLFILSPDFGLARIQANLEVATTGFRSGGAELTGGGDGKLFHFAASERKLSEIDLGRKTLIPMHSFENFHNVYAWAFARYAGKFYLFTSSGYAPSQTTEYDPKTGLETIRDKEIGFTVVGAGQSTLAPPPDATGSITGDFPEK